MENREPKGYSLLLAIDQNYGIGKDGQLPWPHLKSDIKHFVEVTTRPHIDCYDSTTTSQTTACTQPDETPCSRKLPLNAVVMGSKTWYSIPKKYRPLKNRLSVILTQNREKFLAGLSEKERNCDFLRVYEDLNRAFYELENDDTVREIVVIGGAAITKACLVTHKETMKYIVLTRVYGVFD